MRELHYRKAGGIIDGAGGRAHQRRCRGGTRGTWMRALSMRAHPLFHAGTDTLTQLF